LWNIQESSLHAVERRHSLFDMTKRFDSEQQNRFNFLRAQGHTAIPAARATRGMIGKGTRVESWARHAATGKPHAVTFASSPTRA
jgi:hypothetical protein